MEKKVSHGLTKSPNLLRNWLLWIYGTAAFFSFLVLFTFWFTNAFRNLVLSNLELRNGSSTYLWWQRPPVRMVYRIYIFNYTNTYEFENGIAKKLRVQELGPYVYRETVNRVNPVMHSNGTVTYQEKRTYQWEGGRPDDEIIIVPNVPLGSAVAFSRDTYLFAKLSLTAILTTLQSKSFVEVPAGGFLWGYDDKLFDMSKHIVSLKRHIPFDKFGILAFKQGVNGDRITMHTGFGNLDNLGLIQRVNGMDTRNVWADRRCDAVYGTDGSMFPPNLIEDRNATLYVYVKDMCRKMPLRFHSYASAHGIPSLRYKLPGDVATYTRTKNSCYCTPVTNGDVFVSRICPPKGIFNVSTCGFESPLLMSFPHFYAGDQWLVDQVDGLNPRQELHETYVDLHQRLGVPIGGWTRMQINLEIRKAVGVPFFGRLKDGSILPLVWIEAGIDKIPESVLTVLLASHFTAAAVEAGFQWCSLVAFCLFSFAFLHIVQKHRTKRHAILQRNLSGQDKLIE